MNNPPLVSILINNYNYAHFLKAAIDSALQQTYPHTEVIVVDDGSQDHSPDILASYGKQIIPILKENGGQASAFNVGFAKSQGEIICFLDADDLFKPDKVKILVQAFIEHPEIGWFFHPLELFQEATQTLKPIELHSDRAGVYDLQATLNKGSLRGQLPFSGPATSAMVFRRSLLEKILPMPEEIRITSDDYIKYAAMGISPGYFCLDPLAQQRIHGNNAYTLQEKLPLICQIQILNAYWLHRNFPPLAKFTHNILALGINLYWGVGLVPPESQKKINNYLSSISPFEIFFIYLKSLYYCLKK